jgi:tetratricopeptide (TPR) repeat protein
MLYEAESLTRQSNNTQSSEYVALLEILASFEFNISNRADLAREYLLHGLRIAQRIYGKDDPHYAEILVTLSGMMTSQGKLKEAESFAREAVKICAETLPEKHPRLIGAKLSLATPLWRQGKLTEAKSLAKQSLADAIAFLGEHHPALINIYTILAKIQLLQHEPAEAEVNLRKALALSGELPKNNVYEAAIHRDLGEVFLEEKKNIDAEQETRMALSLFKATRQRDDSQTLYTEYVLSRILVNTNRLKVAELLLREIVTNSEQSNSPIGVTALSEGLLGVVLVRLHNSSEAGKYLIHADQVLSREDTGTLPNENEIAHKRLEIFNHCETEHRLDKCDLPI